MSTHQRMYIILALIPITLIAVMCGALPIGARTPLLRHRHWYGEIGRLGLWIGDPVDMNDGPMPFVQIDDNGAYLFIQTAIPLEELGHYWYTTVMWSKQ